MDEDNHKVSEDNAKSQATNVEKTSKNYNTALFVLTIVNVVVYVIMIFFNIAAGQPIGIFKSTTGDISDGFEVSITPAGATFSTWGVIYTWLSLFLVFNVVLLFLKDSDNNRLYHEPLVLSIIFHSFLLLNFVFNAAWLALWDSQLFTWSWVFITFMVISIYAAIFISTKNTYEVESKLKNRLWVLWLYRVFVNNGLTFYGTWLTVATMLNLAITITYKWAPAGTTEQFKSTSGIISLSILTTILVAYFACDVFFLEKYLRYTWSAYIQLTVAFSGILGKHWKVDADQTVAIFTLVLALLVGVMFITKICVTLYKAFTEHKTKVSDDVKI